MPFAGLDLQATGAQASGTNGQHHMDQFFATAAIGNGHGILLIGDVGFEDYKSGCDYLKARQDKDAVPFWPKDVDFDNLGGICGLLWSNRQAGNGCSKLVGWRWIGNMHAEKHWCLKSFCLLFPTLDLFWSS